MAIEPLGLVKALFFRWIAELGKLFPSLSSRLAMEPVGQYVVYVNGDKVAVFQAGDVLDAEGLNQSACASEELHVLLPIRSEEAKLIAIAIPAHQVLRKTIHLPSVAMEEDIRRLLNFEIERLTPFHLSDVYFDYVVSDHFIAGDKIAVELAVAPRLVVDHALAAVEKYGVAVMGIYAIDANGIVQHAMNLLPSERRQRQLSTASFGQIAAVSLALLLLLAVIVMPLWEKRSVVVAMNIKIAEVSEVAGRASRTNAEMDHLMTQHDFLQKKRMSQPPVTEMLNRLTVLLPEDTWVQDLSLEGRKLHLHGETGSSSEILSVLEGADMFQGAQYVSPLTKAASGKEKFHLVVNLEGDDV
ncbi:MAG: pilus assembly protein PilM [Mariprofundaceae bacterium]